MKIIRNVCTENQITSSTNRESLTSIEQMKQKTKKKSIKPTVDA